MKLKIFTDVSVKDNKAVTTCLILSDTVFIGYAIQAFEDVTSSVQGELLGILHGLRYAREHCSSYVEQVLCYTDSQSAINILRNPKLSKSQSCKDVANCILEETSDIDVSYELIVGHQQQHNPNKVVDLVSNNVLRIMNE